MVQPERVGPLFISSFGSSAVRAQGIAQIPRTDTKPAMASYFFKSNARDDKKTVHPTRWFDSSPKHHKAVTTCQEERARQAANSKKTRPHSSTNARHSMQSAGYAECQSTTTQSRTPQMTASTSTTSTQSASIPNSNSTQQASNQATPAATDCAATKTRQHQSEHSQDNG